PSVFPRWATVDPAGVLVAGVAAASVLHRAFGTAVDGATRLQFAVPLVRRVVGGRSGVGRDGVLQEPRPVARRRDPRAVLQQCAQPAASAPSALQRALLGGWDADRGVGQHEELRAQGWRYSALRKAPRRERQAQRRAQLPWRET